MTKRGLPYKGELPYLVNEASIKGAPSQALINVAQVLVNELGDKAWDLCYLIAIGLTESGTNIKCPGRVKSILLGTIQAEVDPGSQGDHVYYTYNPEKNRYSGVYHTSKDCDYLKNMRTGAVTTRFTLDDLRIFGVTDKCSLCERRDKQ